MITIDDIRAAAALLEGKIVRTPFLPAPRLSALTGAEVFVKFENMQQTGAFKERGARVTLERLSPEARARGVIAMSAGNHAQAVACHAEALGIPATIVMPVGTPQVKVENTARFGARVILDGATLAESETRVKAIIAAEGLTLVHPYDDANVIAGQGTIALEMLEEQPDLDCVVIPVGGGGLFSGNAIALHALRPDLEVIGVEVESYPSFRNAIRGESRAIGGATLAEGIAVKNVGQLTLPIVAKHAKHLIVVPESAVERAVDAFATELRTMAEGAGAAGLAALLHQPEAFRGKRVGLILCGGNIDARLLASIMVRELERRERIVSLRIRSDDKPGVLGQISTRLGALGANILEVNHRRTFLSVPAKGVLIDVTIETRGAEHAEAITAALSAEGYRVERIDTGGAPRRADGDVSG